MSALVIAIGNPLRRDDGVAHRVVESLDDDMDLEKRFVLQLTPEIATEMGAFSAAIFVDAHVNSNYPLIRPVDKVLAQFPFTHVSSPAEIVAVARSLFGFSGQAYICRIPASDFSEGEGLSTRSNSFVKKAAREIESLVAAL